MSSWSWKAGLAGVAILAAGAYAAAQMVPMHRSMHDGMGAGSDSPGSRMMNGPMHGQTQGRGMRGPMDSHAMMAGLSRPTMPGNDAFGTIQEIVQILENDPATDWSKVDIAALREHLIDMNEVTLHAKADEHPLANGVEIAVTGQGRTLAAIKRMVPAHAHELAKLGWNASTEELPDGVKLTVTGNDAKAAIKLKALGFMGIMVQGGHHQLHHLMMARGEMGTH
jgi:hypothetical protein